LGRIENRTSSSFKLENGILDENEGKKTNESEDVIGGKDLFGMSEWAPLLEKEDVVTTPSTSLGRGVFVETIGECEDWVRDALYPPSWGSAVLGGQY
jgi:hypothetical protein